MRQPVTDKNLNLVQQLPSTPPAPRPCPPEPDAQFLHDLDLAIRGGATCGVAARWLGVPKLTWNNWTRRRGKIYDELHATIERATAALELRLHNEVARRSPALALRQLHPESKVSADFRRHVERAAKRYGLSFAEEIFCRTLVDTPGENATLAVKRTGAWAAKSHGSIKNRAVLLMKQPRIQERLAVLRFEALAKYEKTHAPITRERVLAKIASLAFSNIRDVTIIDEHGMSVKRSDEWTEQAAEAVQSVQNTPEGVKVTLHNPAPALEILAEFVGLKKAQVEGFGGIVQIQRAVVMLPDNGRDTMPPIAMNGSSLIGETTNGSTPSAAPIQRAVVQFPPRDPEPEPGEPEPPNDVERELGLS